MALEIFKLVGSVFVDTDKANDSLSKTDKKASGVASSLGKFAKGAGAVALGVAGAATAVGAATLSMANDVSASADEIDKASIRMGISTDSYQELAYAAGQCGVEMSTMEQAAKKLEGTDLNFEDAISQIMSLGTAEERSAAAAELFGEKIAYNLSPLIEQSGEDFDGLIDRAHQLGLVMSEDTVKGGVQFGDLMSDIKQSVGSLATSLAGALFPILNEVIEGILAFMPQIQDYLGQLAPFWANLLDSVLPVLFEILAQLFPIAMEIVGQIMPLLLELVSALLPLIMSLTPLLEPLLQVVMAILVPLTEMLTNLLPPLIGVITTIINAIIPTLTKMISGFASDISFYINGVFGVFMPIINAIMTYLEGLGTFLTGVFTGNWKMAWDGIVGMVKGSVNLIIGMLNGLINSFIFTINNLIRSVLTLVDAIPVIDIPVNDIKIPNVEIPMLAKGGIITGEGSAIVGEEGAELLTLPKGAKVQPLNNNSNGIDYERLANTIVEALTRSGAIGDIVIQNKIGNTSLDNLVVDSLARANYRSGGR